jgi:HEPN domain-containing protein
MMPITREWASKAEGDFATASRELRSRKDPNYDAVCFHSQQCLEKYLKARLVESSIAFSKTHDLAILLAATLPVEPTWASFSATMTVLSSYAVTFRYPGSNASKGMAQQAMKDTRQFRLLARKSLGFKNAKPKKKR